ncbi:MAG: tail fiber protein [Bacteroidia bacterium]|nr:tail fiber protein [Bacteroidia bacterium]
MQSFIGTIQPFGFNFAPRNWAKCDGQLISIAQNSALFSLIGTYYGGNGTTNFALPDLRGRTSLCWGQGPGLTDRPIGQPGGTETTTVTVNNMPAHNHVLTGTAHGTAQVNSAAGQQDSPASAVPAVSPNDDYTTVANASGLTNSVIINTSGLGLSHTGGNQSVNNMQPYTVVNWCICLYGIYPSRG